MLSTTFSGQIVPPNFEETEEKKPDLSLYFGTSETSETCAVIIQFKFYAHVSCNSTDLNEKHCWLFCFIFPRVNRK